MSESFVPAGVELVEMFRDAADPDLFPEEEAVVADAVDERRNEFGTVRVCARTALARLGIGRVPIVPGLRGSPTWPRGVVGSLTHCAGYRAALIARSEDMVTVGIDAEPNLPLPDPGVLQLVSLPRERTRLPGLRAARPDVCWDRLLFSAKETVYKAWFPLTRQWLEFEEADISFDPFEGTFDARLLVPGPVVDGTRISGFTGRWIRRGACVVTVITLARDLSAPRKDAGAARPAQVDRAGPALS